jgi:hypothetical protein
MPAKEVQSNSGGGGLEIRKEVDGSVDTVEDLSGGGCDQPTMDVAVDQSDVTDTGVATDVATDVDVATGLNAVTESLKATTQDEDHDNNMDTIPLGEFSSNKPEQEGTAGTETILNTDMNINVDNVDVNADADANADVNVGDVNTNVNADANADIDVDITITEVR